MNLNSIVQELQFERQQQAKGQPVALDNTSPTGSGSSSSSTNSTGSATITADDFLTLLVSELQNQDPTADTDPNEYVNQLVDVNSLQQLISINQEVGSLDPSSAASGSGSVTAAPASASSPASVTTATPVANPPAGYSAWQSLQSSSLAAASHQALAGQVLDPSHPAGNAHSGAGNSATSASPWPGTGVTP
jgi:flagellar basal-body rod modification protein FlgD